MGEHKVHPYPATVGRFRVFVGANLVFALASDIINPVRRQLIYYLIRRLGYALV